MKKIALIILSLLVFNVSTYANSIKKHIKNTNFSRGTKYSVYVVNKNDGSIVYKKHEKREMFPASVLKILTFGTSYMILGEDYQFETSIYKDESGDYYIKLGGDVLLTQKDLDTLIAKIPKKDFKKIYIDDSIFENMTYPNSWLHEDRWPYTRVITPYIINNNYVVINLTRSSLASKIDVVQKDSYMMPVINELKLGEVHDVDIIAPEDDSLLVRLKGTVLKDDFIKLPVYSPEINFNIKLRKSLEKNKLPIGDVIEVKRVPIGASKVASSYHSIKEISKLVLHNSDNFAAEVVFRVAASKLYNYERTVKLEDALLMFNNIYCDYLEKDEKIADASGVSRENQLSAKTISEIMQDLFKKTNIEELLATSNQGTLKNRTIFLANNLKAKTGTLRGQSSIAGTLKTRNGSDLLFVSIVQDTKTRNSLLKHYEDVLMSLLYKEY